MRGWHHRGGVRLDGVRDGSTEVTLAKGRLQVTNSSYQCTRNIKLKPAIGRPCIPPFLVSGTVPTFTCDCLLSEITSVARVAHVLLLRSVAGNMDVNTLASKPSELIGNAAIARKSRVIHKKATCASVFQLPRVARKRRNARSTCANL